MKKYFTLIFISLLALTVKSQGNRFPLYFEDSAGNRDTLYFGFDPSATFDVDSTFGEMNMINEPLDTIFDAFFTDAASNQGIMPSGTEIDDWCLEFPHAPTYILNKQVNNYNSFPKYWIELGLIAKNWPVTISWDQNEMKDYVTDLGNPNWNLYLYSWNPPVSLIGDVHCCGYWPNDYTLLNGTSQVIVNESNFCHYASTITKDSVNLFFIYYSLFTSVADINIGKFTCMYEQREKSILFSNFGEINSFTVNVFDLQGRIHLHKTIENNYESNLRINANMLLKGVYIVSVSSVDKKSLFITQKIQIQ